MRDKVVKFKKFKESKSRITSGIVFIYNDKILLLHPINEKWTKSMSYPKGKKEDGESIIDAAIRETKEEIGVHIPKYLLSDSNLYKMVNYDKDFNNLLKIDYYYLVYVDDFHFDILFNKKTILPKSKLQKKEIDWAGFLTKKISSEKIKPRLKEVLKHIK